MGACLNFQQLLDEIQRFSDERDWGKFHLPRSLVLALQSELGELSEIVQWTSDVTLDSQWITEHSDRLSEEIADVFIYLVRLCQVTGIDLLQATEDKIDANSRKYPVDKSSGIATKYTNL